MPRRKTKRNVKRNENIDPDVSIADGADDRILKKEAFLRDFDIQGISISLQLLIYTVYIV